MNELSKNLVPQEFFVREHGRNVPGVLWLPNTNSPAPLVLVGHGGSQHKLSNSVVEAAQCLTVRYGFAVAAIDGPVHGARRGASEADSNALDDFRAAWESEFCLDRMVEDWLATLKYLKKLDRVDLSRIGYYGLSMGTAFGISLVASELRMKAAVLGMWGTSRGHAQRLLDDAKRIKCPTMYWMRWHDQIFPKQAQFDLFESLASESKRLVAYPGAHIGPTSEQSEGIAEFIAQELFLGSSTCD